MTGVGALGGSSPPVPFETKPAGTMGQTDFLRLMTTQLTTQDPFNPVDNTQMVAQMAQFSQLAGITEMNKSMAAIAAALAPGRLSDAASWIGRAMLVPSSIASPLADGGYAGEIVLAKDADQVTVSFVDADGTLLHSQALGPQAAGSLSFSWDGKDAAGELRADGPVKVVVSAGAAGETVAAGVSSWTMIRGIQSPAAGGTTQLVTGLGLLSPEDAIRLA